MGEKEGKQRTFTTKKTIVPKVEVLHRGREEALGGGKTSITFRKTKENRGEKGALVEDIETEPKDDRRDWKREKYGLERVKEPGSEPLAKILKTKWGGKKGTKGGARP